MGLNFDDIEIDALWTDRFDDSSRYNLLHVNFSILANDFGM